MRESRKSPDWTEIDHRPTRSRGAPNPTRHIKVVPEASSGVMASAILETSVPTGSVRHSCKPRVPRGDKFSQLAMHTIPQTVSDGRVFTSYLTHPAPIANRSPSRNSAAFTGNRAEIENPDRKSSSDIVAQSSGNRPARAPCPPSARITRLRTPSADLIRMMLSPPCGGCCPGRRGGSPAAPTSISSTSPASSGRPSRTKSPPPPPSPPIAPGPTEPPPPPPEPGGGWMSANSGRSVSQSSGSGFPSKSSLRPPGPPAPARACGPIAPPPPPPAPGALPPPPPS